MYRSCLRWVLPENDDFLSSHSVIKTLNLFLKETMIALHDSFCCLRRVCSCNTVLYICHLFFILWWIFFKSDFKDKQSTHDFLFLPLIKCPNILLRSEDKQQRIHSFWKKRRFIRFGFLLSPLWAIRLCIESNCSTHCVGPCSMIVSFGKSSTMSFVRSNPSWRRRNRLFAEIHTT